MNADDFQIAEAWNTAGFISFGRFNLSEMPTNQQTHWVVLSDAAWVAAAKHRKIRALRSMYEDIQAKIK